MMMMTMMMMIMMMMKNRINPSIITAHAKVVIIGLILLSIVPLVYHDIADVEVIVSPYRYAVERPSSITVIT
jgi:hypothetical protein